MQSRELRCGRVFLAVATVLSLAAPSARAQVHEGVPTSIAMALTGGLAALNAVAHPPMSYAGRDADGVPHYVTRPFSAKERELLRRHFGIEDPSRLYLSDSTATGHLNYDTQRDPGAGRLVRSYRVGAASIRRDGESWEGLERRLRTLRPADFARSPWRSIPPSPLSIRWSGPGSSGSSPRPVRPAFGCGSPRPTGLPSGRPT
jgi:hypothetical protein